jgi:hypothetical protein
VTTSILRDLAGGDGGAVDLHRDVVAQASVGFGLWLSLAGAVTGIVGGWLSRR